MNGLDNSHGGSLTRHRRVQITDPRLLFINLSAPEINKFPMQTFYLLSLALARSILTARTDEEPLIPQEMCRDLNSDGCCQLIHIPLVMAGFEVTSTMASQEPDDEDGNSRFSFYCQVHPDVFIEQRFSISCAFFSYAVMELQPYRDMHGNWDQTGSCQLVLPESNPSTPEREENGKEATAAKYTESMHTQNRWHRNVRQRVDDGPESRP